MSQFFFNFKEKYFIEKLLIILIPFLFIFSRFFLEISLIYITFSSLIKIYKKKEFNYLNNNFFKFFILFYMIILFCYLVRNENIDPRRLKAVGYGGDQPVGDNDTDAGRQKNRRTEIRIIAQ